MAARADLFTSMLYRELAMTEIDKLLSAAEEG